MRKLWLIPALVILVFVLFLFCLHFVIKMAEGLCNFLGETSMNAFDWCERKS